MAGVMGGRAQLLQRRTPTDVLFEAAFFPPAAIAGRGRRHGLVTDAGQRFERGVDPTHQERAVERATGLLLEIAGGKAGPVHVVQIEDELPRRPEVPLRRDRIAQLLGTTIADNDVRPRSSRSACVSSRTGEGWLVTPPSHRFDITIEPDLIEELARIVGFEAIAEADDRAHNVRALAEEAPVESQALEILARARLPGSDHVRVRRSGAAGQAVSRRETPALANPISADMSVMRVSLWPGLIKAARENQRRQQDRSRLFEHGAQFGIGVETDLLAGIAAGARRPEQWGAKTRPVDFYDVKADLEALFARTGAAEEFAFVADALPCLHPGRSARITRRGKSVGWIGELHPELVRSSISHMRRFSSKSNTFAGSGRPKCRVLRRSPASRGCAAISRWSSTRKCLCDSYMNV